MLWVFHAMLSMTAPLKVASFPYISIPSYFPGRQTDSTGFQWARHRNLHPIPAERRVFAAFFFLSSANADVALGRTSQECLAEGESALHKIRQECSFSLVTSPFELPDDTLDAVAMLVLKTHLRERLQMYQTYEPLCTRKVTSACLLCLIMLACHFCTL